MVRNVGLALIGMSDKKSIFFVFQYDEESIFGNKNKSLNIWGKSSKNVLMKFFKFENFKHFLGEND